MKGGFLFTRAEGAREIKLPALCLHHPLMICAFTVYVLHAFQKKSKSGRETPRAEMDLVERRLREAERMARGER